MRRTPPSGPIRFEVYLDRDLHRRLRLASIEEGVSAAAIVRSLIEGWVNGQNETDDDLGTAYEAGVQAERDRVRRLIDPPAAVPLAVASGLPVRPLAAQMADTSTDVDTDS